MKTKILKFSLFTAILGIGLFACNKTSLNTFDNKAETNIEPSGLNINQLSTPINRLLEIRSEFVQKVYDNNVDLTQLKNAYLSNDTNEIKNLLSLTNNEINDIENELNSLRSSILGSNQEILDSDSTCVNCMSEDRIEYLFANFSSYANRASGQQVNDAMAIECNWPLYTACLLVCTTTGPIIYFACALLCMDTYC